MQAHRRCLRVAWKSCRGRRSRATRTPTWKPQFLNCHAHYVRETPPTLSGSPRRKPTTDRASKKCGCLFKFEVIETMKGSDVWIPPRRGPAGRRGPLRLRQRRLLLLLLLLLRHGRVDGARAARNGTADLILWTVAQGRQIATLESDQGQLGVSGLV